ncbi:MAG: hypothetical protein AUJ92_13445 [Armatimonadetes bacterium CG2_30_59_28]|nr:MAG: hypothetical protein AUJ92_13445 [Armatimonadetes bacterium CG2_30_59_28]PIU66171.1 MAG: acetoin utilization protein AcuC [Armatimonadetes bacterium CG07_land_8_20_14_0_80_59_28]PIX41685.1 MAG: acetoin utilization protein AcuC [Armatimonadetes bacterium CG_4_8_14_3_um_filter_58_9]PIY37727.1 MAG: acetoin utilization protein AcuC [Armatimonadetes bacterium CG_4_10_14_3_um_filter_59_10]PJB62039.1 MAG: acetoin utilization protein AcuC [Armatimonadetes bacterium CG_4_9_14_3_um_filter_58_7]
MDCSVSKALFVYSDTYSGYSLGDTHPMKLIRLKLTHDLARACNLLDGEGVCIADAPSVEGELLRRVHDPEYLKVLEASNDGHSHPAASRFGLGSADCPIIPGIWDFSILSAGASAQCAQGLNGVGASVAFNIAGGLHHALANRASGFCYLNDPAVAIRWLLEHGRRVAYIDIDAHHGDGVQWLFYDTDRVLTISLHETGQFLFPGTGFEHETGRGAGQGYAVNVPLLPYTDDEVFCWAFDEVVPPFIEAFQPDCIVSQLGCDAFRDDPLTDLDLTTNGFCHMVQSMKELASGHWVTLGGGGYRVNTVARAWTLAWGIMLGRDVSDEIPEAFIAEIQRSGVMESFPEFRCVTKLRDQPYRSPEVSHCRSQAERVVDRLLKEVLPQVKSVSSVAPPELPHR